MTSLITPRQNDTKYDLAMRIFFLLFYTAGLIVFVAVGLQHMTAQAWILGFICAAAGATAYGMIAKLIIDLIRKDKPKAKADILIRMFYFVFFVLATVAWLAIGFQHHSAKTWVVAFVGAYGAAFIYGSIAWLIITLARKDKNPHSPFTQAEPPSASGGIDPVALDGPAGFQRAHKSAAIDN